MLPGSFKVAAVILSSRESPEKLWAAIASATADPALIDGVLDVVVNGNPELAEACNSRCSGGGLSKASQLIRLWYVPLGDKSHAWNVYIHDLWPGGECTVFIDGYVRVESGALGHLGAALQGSPEVLAVTGVPTVGRSAPKLRRAMLDSGGIHGNLYGLSKTAVEWFRGRGFRLPLGLYRTDALLGAILNFGFSPEIRVWDSRRIRVVPDATWQFEPLRWWVPKDIWAHCRRLIRQRQGLLENLAYRNLFVNLRCSPMALPPIAAQLVNDWVESNPVEAERAQHWRPLVKFALRRLRNSRDWSSANEPARLLWQSKSRLQTDCNRNAVG